MKELRHWKVWRADDSWKLLKTFCHCYFKWATFCITCWIFRSEKDWTQAESSSEDWTLVSLAGNFKCSMICSILKDNFCWLQVFRGIWEKDSTGWNGEDGGDMAVFFLCYAQTLLGCPFVSLPDFLYLEPYPWRAKKDWHWVHWNNMWKLQERLDFSFMFLNNDVLPTPLDKIFLSSNSVMTLSPTFSMFQVLHQVVILIFYWPTQISPRRRRSRYFHIVGLEKMFLLLLFLIPFWFCLVILFAFFFSPNSCMQLLIIWSPLGSSQTLCPKETPSLWWGLCLFPLICWSCF